MEQNSIDSLENKLKKTLRKKQVESLLLALVINLLVFTLCKGNGTILRWMNLGVDQKNEGLCCQGVKDYHHLPPSSRSFPLRGWDVSEE